VARSCPSSVRLEEMFRAYANRVYAYALHRVGMPAAADVVSETFLAAWRRIDEVPEGALPWLLGTARRVVANEFRRQERRTALLERLASAAGPASADTSSEHVELIEALQQMSESDREVLLLSAWYELRTAEAASVLGCSAGAYAVRLHRARRRLREQLDGTVR
jgi:RNA polymerase sigma-70 factor, ECF subfamily